jgi:hypothetical protein
MRPVMATLIVRTAALGLIAWGATAPARAGGVPDSRRGLRVAPLLLLTRVDVRDELKLTPEQTADAERIISDVIDKGLSIVGKHDASAMTVRESIDHTSRTWLVERLSASQRTRLLQLDLQWEGPSSVMRPMVAASLELTPEQTARLSRAIAARNKNRNDGPPISPDESRLKATVLTTLSATQRETWQAMVGPEFSFQVASREPAGAPVRR